MQICWNLALTIKFHGLNLLSYGFKPVIYLDCCRKDRTKHLCLGQTEMLKQNGQCRLLPAHSPVTDLLPRVHLL